ncbi:MAG: hypothetical protein ACR2H3_17090 [Acidimicrobiales bacterium]
MSASKQRHRAGRRRRTIGVGLALAALAGGVAVFATRSGDGEVPSIADRVGSSEVADASPIEFGDEPSAYRIVYRLEQAGADDALTVNTDVVSVNRPFESRLETKRGAPPGGDLLSVQVGRLGHLETRGPSRATATVGAELGVPPSDVRVAAVIDDLIDRGKIERREQRKVAGRMCQVVRSAVPFSATSIEAATTDEYADNCVDGTGLVLEEFYVVDGKPISRRVATKVDIDPTFAANTFRTERVTIPVNKGGGSVRELEPASRPEGEAFYELGAVPTGFVHDGRFSVVPPQAVNFSDPLRRKFILATVTDVYTRGADAIVVDQGSTLEGGAAFPPAPEGTPTVEAGALGTAEVHFDARGAELRAHTGSGAFVRVYGTVPVARLLEIIRTLQPTTGTGLAYLGGG